MKNLCLIFLVGIMAGCASNVIKNTDPFRTEFIPIASASIQEPEIALKKVVSLLNKEGFLVSPNTVFYTATTDPKNVGYQYWRVTNEKWNVTYQLGVQIIKVRGGLIYWKLSHKIIGSRSGKQDRMFEPSDFEVTEQVVNKITRKLMILFSTSA